MELMLRVSGFCLVLQQKTCSMATRVLSLRAVRGAFFFFFFLYVSHE